MTVNFYFIQISICFLKSCVDLTDTTVQKRLIGSADFFLNDILTVCGYSKQNCCQRNGNDQKCNQVFFSSMCNFLYFSKLFFSTFFLPTCNRFCPLPDRRIGNAVILHRSLYTLFSIDTANPVYPDCCRIILHFAL